MDAKAIPLKNPTGAKMKTEFLPLFLLLLAVAGCGGPDFSGTWTGETVTRVGGQSISTTITLIAAQSGNSVTGTWSSATGNSAGTFSGTAVGARIDPFIVTISSSSSCPGSLIGAVVLSADALTGTALGTTTACGDLNQSFTLNKKH